MRILPVIDLLRGVVVRGVAGNRSEYRPIQSRWTPSSEPLDVAAALQQAFGFRRFYLADLDAILSQRPNFETYRQLTAAGFELLVDAGVRDATDVGPILTTGAASVIVGLETLSGPAALAEMIRTYDTDRIVFSLDLCGGIPTVSSTAKWSQLREPEALARNAKTRGLASASGSLHDARNIPVTPGPSPSRGEGGQDVTPLAIAETAVCCGVRRMIVLDLADVGTGTGGSTAELCRAILQRHPELQLIAGGGVRGPDDLGRWSQVGVSELLVASALHDGRLMPENLR